MVCANISKLRKLQGNMTDEQFAKLLNVTRQYWGRIKNNKNSAGDKLINGFRVSFPNENVDEYFFLSRRAEERKLKWE